MSIMGWSSTAMAKRYQHAIDEVRTKVAKKVGGRDGDDEDGTTAVPIPP